jgi:hypothetical protein
MRRYLYVLLGLVLAFGLTSCGTTTPTTSSEPGLSGLLASPTSAADPDGDGDTKGSDHFPMQRPATGNKVFIFDPNHNSWAAYDAQGVRVNTGRASGGKYYCPDINRSCKTVTGRFRIISKGGADCISSKFPIETNGGAPMPYCMYFHPKGYAVHGSNDVPDANASHGCVRITPAAAKWLNENFMTIGTSVIIHPY